MKAAADRYPVTVCVENEKGQVTTSFLCESEAPAVFLASICAQDLERTPERVRFFVGRNRVGSVLFTYPDGWRPSLTARSTELPDHPVTVTIREESSGYRRGRFLCRDGSSALYMATLLVHRDDFVLLEVVGTNCDGKVAFKCVHPKARERQLRIESAQAQLANPNIGYRILQGAYAEVGTESRASLPRGASQVERQSPALPVLNPKRLK